MCPAHRGNFTFAITVGAFTMLAVLPVQAQDTNLPVIEARDTAPRAG